MDDLNPNYKVAQLQITKLRRDYKPAQKKLLNYCAEITKLCITQANI